MADCRVVRLDLWKVNQVGLAVVDSGGCVHVRGVLARRDVVPISCLRRFVSRCRNGIRRIVRCIRSGSTRNRRGLVATRRVDRLSRGGPRRLARVARFVMLRLFYYLVLLNNGVLLVVRHIMYVVDFGGRALYIGVASRDGRIPRLVQIPCHMRLHSGKRLDVARRNGIGSRVGRGLGLGCLGREGRGVLLLKLRREVRNLGDLRKVREVRARARRIVVHDLAVSWKNVQAPHEVRTAADVVLKRVDLRNLRGQRGRAAHVHVMRTGHVGARRGGLALLALRLLLRGKVLRIAGGRLGKVLALRGLLGRVRGVGSAMRLHLVANGAHTAGDACRGLLEEGGNGVRRHLGLRGWRGVGSGLRRGDVVCLGVVRVRALRVRRLHSGCRACRICRRLGLHLDLRHGLCLSNLFGSVLPGSRLGRVVAVLASVLPLAGKRLRILLALLSQLLPRELLHRLARVQRNIALRGIVGGTHHVHHAQHCRKRGLVVVRTRRAGCKLLIDGRDSHRQQRKRRQNAHDPEYVPKAFWKKAHQLYQRADRDDHRAIERRALQRGLVPCNLGAAQQVLVRAVVMSHNHDGAVALHHKRAGGAVHADYVLAATPRANVAQHVTAGKLHGKQHEGSRHKNEAHRAGDGPQKPRQQNTHKHNYVKHVVRKLPL